jgi:hypothetical protein
MFVAEVRKIIGKRNLSEKEFETMKKAALIAALSSNHSWKTHKYLNSFCGMDKGALAEEFDYARKEGWKRITEGDVEEVINGNFNQYLLSMWFYYAMGEDGREEYSPLFTRMKKELAYGLEPMEKRV